MQNYLFFSLYEEKLLILIALCSKVSRNKEKEGFAMFEENGYDKIYEDIHKYSLR